MFSFWSGQFLRIKFLIVSLSFLNLFLLLVICKKSIVIHIKMIISTHTFTDDALSSSMDTAINMNSLLSYTKRKHQTFIPHSRHSKRLVNSTTTVGVQISAAATIQQNLTMTDFKLIVYPPIINLLSSVIHTWKGAAISTWHDCEDAMMYIVEGLTRQAPLIKLLAATRMGVS